MRVNLKNLHPRRRADIAPVKRALRKLKCKVGADIYLTDDRHISSLHKRFLGDPGNTDVMTFPPLPYPPPRGGRARVGEIVISLDTAMRQAAGRKIPLRWELTLLAVHGILHLRGFKDRKYRDWQRMRVAEFETVVKII